MPQTAPFPLCSGQTRGPRLCGMRPRFGPRCWTNGGGFRPVLLRMQRNRRSERRALPAAPGAPRACPRCAMPPRAPVASAASSSTRPKGSSQVEGTTRAWERSRSWPTPALSSLPSSSTCSEIPSSAARASSSARIAGWHGPARRSLACTAVRGTELGERPVGHVGPLLPFHPPHEGDRGLLCGATLQARSSARAARRPGRSSPRRWESACPAGRRSCASRRCSSRSPPAQA